MKVKESAVKNGIYYTPKKIIKYTEEQIKKQWIDTKKYLKKMLDFLILLIILLLNSANSKIITADPLIYNRVTSCRIPLYYYHGSVFYIKEFGMPKGIFKRKPHTQETKDKISKACKGMIFSQERKDNMSKGQKGKKFSKEHCSNMSKREFTWGNKISKALMRDFEKVGYEGKHLKIKRQYGKPYYCELDKKHKSKQFVWANINHQYNKNINEWIQLCDSCHKNFDYGNIDIKIIKNVIKNRKKD